MTDQNIKFKSSVIPVDIPTGTSAPVDTFENGPKASTAPEFTPGNSGYSAANAKTIEWRGLTNTGQKAGTLPDFTDPLFPDSLGLSAIVDEVKARETNVKNARKPKKLTKFDKFRMFFETPDKTKGLKENIPPFYSFSTLKKQFKGMPDDYSFIKRFILQQMGTIKARLTTCDTYRQKEESLTHPNANNLQAIARVKTKLERLMVKYQHELAEAIKWENLNKP